MTDPDDIKPGPQVQPHTVVMSMEQLATERSVAWQAGYEAGCEDTTDPHARMDSIRSDALGKATLAMASIPADDILGRPSQAALYAAYVVQVARIYMPFLTGDDVRDA